MAKVTIKDLLAAGVHFGHQTKRWNPKMKPYIFGARNKITIVDLTITMQKLAEACQFLNETVISGGDILFVGTKRQAQEEIVAAAEKTGMFHISNRWLGGCLTNFQTIRKSIKKLTTYRKLVETEEFAKKGKKEQSSIRREMGKLENNLGGIEHMGKMPAALVVVDVQKESIAVAEAKTLGIPVVALIDTNSNPDLIDYVIPGNDAAIRSIKVILDTLVSSVSAAKVERVKLENEQAAEAAAKKVAADAAKAAAKEEAAAKKAAPAKEAPKKEAAPKVAPATEEAK
ncbi:MAG: 30S ribosomal protein S2 [Lentisphaeria bacterium]|nr:30S ribosomal protein S2 [Lentisphaeria bacterium]